MFSYSDQKLFIPLFSTPFPNSKFSFEIKGGQLRGLANKIAQIQGLAKIDVCCSCVTRQRYKGDVTIPEEGRWHAMWSSNKPSAYGEPLFFQSGYAHREEPR